jgi:hypothetical protein
VALGWFVAVAIAIAIIFSKYDDVKDLDVTMTNAWSNTENSVYEAVTRPLWACAVAWVIWACCVGYGGHFMLLFSHTLTCKQERKCLVVFEIWRCS